MSVKGWIIPYLSMIVGVGFTAFTFITGNEVTPSQYQMLEYLLFLTLGSGAIGAGKKGFEKYNEYRTKD